MTLFALVLREKQFTVNSNNSHEIQIFLSTYYSLAAVLVVKNSWMRNTGPVSMYLKLTG